MSWEYLCVLLPSNCLYVWHWMAEWETREGIFTTNVGGMGERVPPVNCDQKVADSSASTNLRPKRRTPDESHTNILCYHSKDHSVIDLRLVQNHEPKVSAVNDRRSWHEDCAHITWWTMHFRDLGVFAEVRCMFPRWPKVRQTLLPGDHTNQRAIIYTLRGSGSHLCLGYVNSGFYPSPDTG